MGRVVTRTPTRSRLYLVFISLKIVCTLNLRDLSLISGSGDISDRVTPQFVSGALLILCPYMD